MRCHRSVSVMYVVPEKCNSTEISFFLPDKLLDINYIEETSDFFFFVHIKLQGTTLDIILVAKCYILQQFFVNEFVSESRS